MKQRVMAALLGVLLTVLAYGSAWAAPPATEPLPPPPEGSVGLYDRLPLEAWTLDGASADDPVAREERLAVNRLMLLRAWAVKLSIRMMEQALEHRPAQAVAAVAEDLAAELRSAFWEREGAPWVVAGIVVAGFWAMALWVGRRPGGGWRLLLSTVGTLLLTLVLLSSLGGLLRGLEAVSDDLAGIGFGAATRPLVGADGQDPSAVLGERAWRTFVHDPWVAGEFTNAEAADQYSAEGLPGGAMLTLSSAQRLNRYQTLGLIDRERLFAPWGADQLASRWLLAATSLVAAGIWALAVAALSGAIIFYDFLLVMLAVLSPVALLLALFPSVGLRLVTAWGGRLLTAVINKVVAALVLGIFATFSVTLLSLSEGGGWPAASLVQVLLAIVVLRFRLYSPGATVAALAKVRGAALPAESVPRRKREQQDEPVRTEAGTTMVIRPALELLGSGDWRPSERLPPARPAELLVGATAEERVEGALRQLSTELGRLQRPRLAGEAVGGSDPHNGDGGIRAPLSETARGSLRPGAEEPPKPAHSEQRARPVALAPLRSEGGR